MDVRPVRREEVDGVLQLIDEYDRPTAPRPTAEEVRAIYTSITSSGGCVVGAFIDNVLAGTCTVNICPNLSWSGRPYAIIENVIVSKTYRGKGIGKAILHYAKTHAQEVGCYKAALMTGSKDPATHSFYEGAGFMGSKLGYQVRFNA